MKNLVKVIINNWDPMNLLDYSSEDEYSDEISSIINIISDNPEISDDELGNEIDEIFKNSFGHKKFSDKIDECREIANNILEELEN